MPVCASRSTEHWHTELTWVYTVTLRFDSTLSSLEVLGESSSISLTPECADVIIYGSESTRGPMHDSAVLSKAGGVCVDSSLLSLSGCHDHGGGGAAVFFRGRLWCLGCCCCLSARNTHTDSSMPTWEACSW